MKTIKELEAGQEDRYFEDYWIGIGKIEALKDVLELIDERYAGHGIHCTCDVCVYRRELKKRINGNYENGKRNSISNNNKNE